MLKKLVKKNLLINSKINLITMNMKEKNKKNRNKKWIILNSR